MNEEKKCSKCKEDIKSEAKKCKHCGADLRNWFVRHKILSAFLIIIFLSIVASASSDENDSTYNTFVDSNEGKTEKKEEVKKPEYKLELISLNCYKQYNFYHIEGQVKNISDKSQKSVAVVGTVYTEDGKFITSEDVLIDYNPILEGQISPFEVLMVYNPEISKCEVDFKELIGGTIPSKLEL